MDQNIINKAVILIIFYFFLQSCGSINWPVPGVSEQSVSTCPSSWYGNCIWSYRQKITIDESMIPDTGAQDLSNFPVLIKITDQSNPVFTNAASANGYDILFTSSDGITKLDHEIEYYKNTPTKELDVWVRIPTLDYNDDTEIYMYYGNPSITTDPSVTSTWDSNYKGIWHLKEEQAGTDNLGLYQDSTANNNDGDDYVSATGQNGQIDSGHEFDGNDDFINTNKSLSNFISNTTGTMAVWLKPTGAPSSNPDVYNLPAVIGDDGGFVGILRGNVTAGGGGDRIWVYNYDSTPPFADKIGITYNVDEWVHIVWVHANGTLYAYKNGGLVSSKASGNTGSVSGKLKIGSGYIFESNQYFNGLIDEVRVSDTERFADWITTSYNNQNSPGTYLTFGAQEYF